MTGSRRVETVQRPVPATPTSGALRVVRGAAVGLTAMGLALAGHVLAGGSLPTPTAAVALLSLTVTGSIALSGRRWTLAELLCVLLGVQVVFHLAFGRHVPPAGAAMHQHAAHSVSASMVSAHLLAALAAAVVLRRGESWCWRLIELVSRPLQVSRVFAGGSVAGFVGRSVRPDSGALPVLRSLLLADAAPRRGPPALLAR